MTQECLSVCFIEVFLSSSNPLNTFHSSLDVFDGADKESFRMLLKISFSSWFKKSSMKGERIRMWTISM